MVTEQGTKSEPPWEAGFLGTLCISRYLPVAVGALRLLFPLPLGHWALSLDLSNSPSQSEKVSSLQFLPVYPIPKHPVNSDSSLFL